MHTDKEFEEIKLKLLQEHASIISKRFPKEFHVGNYGYYELSSGSASTNACLNGYLEATDAIKFRIYHNTYFVKNKREINENISQLDNYEHPAINNNSQSILTMLVNNQPIYNLMFPAQHLHLGFQWDGLYWLQNPIKLSLGIYPRSNLTTSDELKIISDEAHYQFIQFLQHRSKELMVRGRLVLGILKSSSLATDFDQVWYNYVILNGHELTDLAPVTIPIYQRTAEEIQLALTTVQDEFKLISQREVIINTSDFFKTIKYELKNILKVGLEQSNLFTESRDEMKFVKGLLDNYPLDNLTAETRFELVVLERI